MEKLNLPGPGSRALLERKQKYVPRGIGNSMPFYVREARGALLTDVDGNTFIDFAGGIGVINAGHCPPEVVQAVQEQAARYLHTCFMVVGYQPYVDLAEKLCQITPGSGEKKTFFVNSGAEAVENAVKIARLATKRPAVIAFESAFHGRTLLTMTLTSKVKPYKFGFGPFAPEVYRIPYAYCYRCAYGRSYPDCNMYCLQHFENFFAATVAAEEVAAIIAEPVQGEGGFIVPPPEFFPGLRRLCDRYGILLIADEVQTGFCRTGKMFAVQHWDVEPDLMTMAKSLAAGLPLSAVTGRAEIMDVPDPGQIGGTYGGNPLACVAALAAIEIMESDRLADRAAAIGGYTLERFRRLQDKFPVIGDVRGLGAMVAMEMVKDRQTKEPAKEACAQVVRYCYEHGLVTLSAGVYGNVLRVLMPLCITDDQLEQGLNIIQAALASL